MDFKEFYKLLDSTFDKSEVDVFPSNQNFDLYLFTRYISFYGNTQIADWVSKTFNKSGWLPDSQNEQMAWLGISSMIPKMPKRFIQYVKRRMVNEKQQVIPQQQLTDYAKFFECSQRQIKDLILTIKENGKRSTEIEIV